MWERAEYQFSISQRRVLRGDKRHLVPGHAHGLPPLVVGCGERQREPRMPGDECTQLAAGISAGPEHADGDPIHTECIIMHIDDVNSLSRPSVPNGVLWLRRRLGTQPFSRSPALTSSPVKKSCGTASPDEASSSLKPPCRAIC